MTVTSTPPGIPSAPRLAGWIGGERRHRRAGGRAGREVSRIGYYVASGYFKLAVVLEGIYARCLPRRTVGDGFEHEGLAVPTLVARAHQVLDADDLLQAASEGGRIGGSGAPLAPGRNPAPRSRRALRSASACRAVEVRRPAYAGPLHKTTRYPGGGFTRE